MHLKFQKQIRIYVEKKKKRKKIQIMIRRNFSYFCIFFQIFTHINLLEKIYFSPIIIYVN